MMFFFMMVVTVLLLIALVFSGDRGLKDSDQRGRDDSLQILNNRLARGEITLEEFQRIRAAINS